MTEATKKVGMPSMGGVKEARIVYGIGAGGGVVYAIARAVTGSGFLGGLVGAGLAGSVVKGQRGTTIATILGFQAIVGGMNTVQAAPASADTGTM